VLSPYDVTLVGTSVATKRQWADRVVAQIVAEFGRDLHGVTFELHAGSDYRVHGLESRLAQMGADLKNPTEGMGQGRQLAV
jgi:hypothetical protein